jgi:hypothetical protein
LICAEEKDGATTMLRAKRNAGDEKARSRIEEKDFAA